jgi:hypothetical protein
MGSCSSSMSIDGSIHRLPCNLIETLAARIVGALFDNFSGAERLQVTIHKPQAPIGGKFADVGVTVVRERRSTGAATAGAAGGRCEDSAVRHDGQRQSA